MSVRSKNSSSEPHGFLLDPADLLARQGEFWDLPYTHTSF